MYTVCKCHALYPLKYHSQFDASEPQYNVYWNQTKAPLILIEYIYSTHHLFLNHCVSCSPVTTHAYGWMDGWSPNYCILSSFFHLALSERQSRCSFRGLITVMVGTLIAQTQAGHLTPPEAQYSCFISNNCCDYISSRIVIHFKSHFMPYTWLPKANGIKTRTRCHRCMANCFLIPCKISATVVMQYIHGLVPSHISRIDCCQS